MAHQLTDTLTVRQNAVVRGIAERGVLMPASSGYGSTPTTAVDTVTVQSTSSRRSIVNSGAGNDTVNLGYTRTISPVGQRLQHSRECRWWRAVRGPPTS